MQPTSTTQHQRLNKFLLLIFFILSLGYSQSLSAQNACASCKLGYPDNSHTPRSQQVFSESSMLVALDPGPSVCGKAPEYIKIWYTDEHALLLGVRQVIVKSSTGTTTTNYGVTPTPSSPTCVDHPLVGTTFPSGDQSGNDVAVDGGRPIWPAVFITDLTVNGANSRAGDWQQGGTGTAPSRICGTWKAAVRTVDKTRTPNLVTIQPDVDPAPNGTNLGGGDKPPAGTVFDKYSAEVEWKLSDLKLIPGHSYRLQFMVHDGDQNKIGGDAGDTCTTVSVALASSSIGDFVWDDNGGGNINNNQNGRQDAGEPGIPNIDVLLYNAAGNIVKTTKTDANGKYQFDNVDVSGGCTNYKVEFLHLPLKYTFTFQNKPGVVYTADNNSDVDRNTGQTAYFTVCPGQSRFDIDAGAFNPGGVTPVNLGQFQGKYESGVSKLNWVSFSENNLSSYEIQRSTDGTNFSKIGNVKAVGTSSSSNTYNYTDNIPSAGLNYYRIKSVDNNSGFSYSNVISLNISIRGINIRNVYPNPFVDKVGVDIVTENNQTVELKLIDYSGKTLRKQILTAQKGTNTFYISDLKSLNGGLYLVEVRAGAVITTKKLYKQDR